MEIKVKNMVCNPCIMLVRQIFERAGAVIVNVDLGTVQTKQKLTTEQINFIDRELTKASFEIISGQSARLVEHIKTITIENVYKSEKAFEQILNNEEVFNAFMDRMMEETESMHWMMENQNMMNTMFREENLDYIMSHNENMHQHMMQNMGDIYSDTSRMREWEMMHRDQMGEDRMMH